MTLSPGQSSFVSMASPIKRWPLSFPQDGDCNGSRATREDTSRSPTSSSRRTTIQSVSPVRPAPSCTLGKRSGIKTRRRCPGSGACCRILPWDMATGPAVPSHGWLYCSGSEASSFDCASARAATRCHATFQRCDLHARSVATNRESWSEASIQPIWCRAVALIHPHSRRLDARHHRGRRRSSYSAPRVTKNSVHGIDIASIVDTPERSALYASPVDHRSAAGRSKRRISVTSCQPRSNTECIHVAIRPQRIRAKSCWRGVNTDPGVTPRRLVESAWGAVPGYSRQDLALITRGGPHPSPQGIPCADGSGRWVCLWMRSAADLRLALGAVG